MAGTRDIDHVTFVIWVLMLVALRASNEFLLGA